jgi:hypothetical protein
MLSVTYKPFKLSVTYAECHNKPFKLSVIMLNFVMLSMVTIKSGILGVVMLSTVMLIWWI